MSPCVHPHLVESEQVQAIGRARHLRHDVTVTVFSNCPIPGADYRELPEEWWERMKKDKGEEGQESEFDRQGVLIELEITTDPDAEDVLVELAKC